MRDYKYTKATRQYLVRVGIEDRRESSLFRRRSFHRAETYQTRRVPRVPLEVVVSNTGRGAYLLCWNTGEAVESLSAEADKRFVCVCVL